MALKIPPIIVMVLFALFMWLTAKLLPFAAWCCAGSLSLAGGTAILAWLFCTAGFIEFRRRDTTVDPRQPEKASHLVSTGIYQYTRNPMYVGFALLLLAYGFYLSHWLCLLWVPAFILYMNQFQIEPEEAALQCMFGTDYERYQAKVGRWI